MRRTWMWDALHSAFSDRLSHARMQARLVQHRQSQAAQESALLDREDMRSRIREGLNIRVAGKRSLLDILLTLGIQVHAAPVNEHETSIHMTSCVCHVR